MRSTANTEYRVISQMYIDNSPLKHRNSSYQVVESVFLVFWSQSESQSHSPQLHFSFCLCVGDRVPDRVPLLPLEISHGLAWHDMARHGKKHMLYPPAGVGGRLVAMQAVLIVVERLVG